MVIAHAVPTERADQRGERKNPDPRRIRILCDGLGRAGGTAGGAIVQSAPSCGAPPQRVSRGGPFVEPLTQRGNFAPEIEVLLYQLAHAVTTVENGGVISTIEELTDLR